MGISYVRRSQNRLKLVHPAGGIFAQFLWGAVTLPLEGEFAFLVRSIAIFEGVLPIRRTKGVCLGYPPGHTFIAQETQYLMGAGGLLGPPVSDDLETSPHQGGAVRKEMPGLLPILSTSAACGVVRPVRVEQVVL